MTGSSSGYPGTHSEKSLKLLFVRLSISSSEWHPFTISSAPEVGSHFTLHIRGVGHWTNKLHQLFEDEYRNQRKTRVDSVLGNLRERLSTKYQAWSDSRREGRGERGELELRKQERMRRRETKLNMIAEELQDHRAHRGESETSSQEMRKHLRMRTAKSVKYSPDSKLGQTGDNTRTLTLSEPLEIFVDGPFGSPSSNIYRAEHAVLIGTGIGELRDQRSGHVHVLQSDLGAL